MVQLTNVAPKYFKRPNNTQILAAIHKNATNAYQSRVPAPTKASIDETMAHLLDGRNRPDWNEFVDALLNRIGLELFRVQQFKNPLAKFNSGDLRFGDTIEEIAYGLAEAYVYDVDSDYLEKSIFGQARPEVQAAYHKINRQNYYKLTVNEPMLRRAFENENGLSNYIAGQMAILANSDELDQYVMMTGLFKTYFENGGFFKVNVPNVGADASTAADAKKMLRKVRSYADNLTVLSRHYNAAGLPVKADRDELELFITPEANAAIDVEALAAAFNVESSSMPTRITVVPAEYFKIPGVQAVLTTRDFFIVADSFYQVNRVDNPVGLYENHFLHHHQVLSTSLFVPALLFYTGPGDTITIDNPEVTDVSPITVTDRNGVVVTEVERGEVYALSAGDDENIENKDGIKFRFNDATVPLSSFTLIRQEGRTLNVSLDERLSSITLDAISTDNKAIRTSLTLPIVGEYVNYELPRYSLPDADGDGNLEVTPDKPSQDGNIVTVPYNHATRVTYKDGAANLTPGQRIILTADKTITVVAKQGNELAADAPASWTFTYTA